jgi:hypothetical protein
MPDLALAAIVEKVNATAHEIISLLAARESR